MRHSAKTCSALMPLTPCLDFTRKDYGIGPRLSNASQYDRPIGELVQVARLGREMARQ